MEMGEGEEKYNQSRVFNMVFFLGRTIKTLNFIHLRVVHPANGESFREAPLGFCLGGERWGERESL